MRIEYIVNMIDKCNTLLDVGCDHGRMSKLALDKKICGRVIATDISQSCLDKAKTLLKNYDNAEFVLRDGIPEEVAADFILICGMGGHTISGILSKYNGNAKMLLSPQSHGEQVRHALIEKGYGITYDRCFESGGKYYDLIKAERMGEIAEADELHLKYGMFFESKNASLKNRLLRMLSKLKPENEKYAEISEVLNWQK